MKFECIRPLLFFSLLIGLASCHKGEKVTPVSPGKNLVIPANEQQKVTADNAFALRLFKSVDSTVTDGSNVFISPLSVSFALGMTANGAQGSTLTAFQNTLNFAGLSQSQVNDYYNNLITNLPQLDPNTTLNIANSIWYKNDFSVEPQFLQTDSTYFKARAQALDFSSPSAAATINNWVSQKTNGYIPSIIKQIPADEVMYLVNAMYFKSAWKEKFDPAQTKNMSFYLPDNSTVQAPFMNSDVDFNFYADNSAYVFELPYSNSKYSMVIVEPVYGTSLSSLIPTIDPAKWQGWMSSLRSTKGAISMPKIKFSYGAQLNQELENLGLGVAFSPGSADFLGINPNPTSQLHITEVMHKAYVDVDENGTTAAAATSVGMGISAIEAPPAINHPYVFAIREMSSGIILFIGTVNNPLLQGN